MPSETDVIRVETEYKTNELGQKIKIIRKIRERKIMITSEMLRRRTLKKFGDCAGFPPGPDSKSTTVGEPVFLDLSMNMKEHDKEKEEEKAAAKAAGSKILCRHCNGAHWSTKCPYKDTIEPEKAAASKSATAGILKLTSEATGKYVPPSRRSGATATSMSERDDTLTVRITNLSVDTTDRDVRDLVSSMGMVTRTFLAKDQQTGKCKGYAFVSFMDRQSVQNCIDKLNGFGYDSLILKVEVATRNN